MENIEQYKVPEQNPLPEIRFTFESQYTDEENWNESKKPEEEIRRNKELLAELHKPLIKARQEELEQLERNGTTPEEYLGPEFKRFEKLLEDEIQAYYAELGFDAQELCKRPVFVLDPKDMPGKRTGGTFQGKYPAAIKMRQFDITDPELRIYIFMDTLGHERYHDTSQAGYLFNKKTNKVDWAGMGIFYKEVGREARGKEITYPGAEKKPRAIEEGYALLFQRRFNQILRRQFPPELMANIDEAKRQVAHQREIDTNNQDIGFLDIKTEEGGRWAVDTYVTEYPVCVRLVRFLEEQVPDFHRLVEMARIRHDSRGLAKACRDAFGEKEAYRKIVTTPATKEDVENLMAYLQERLEAVD